MDATNEQLEAKIEASNKRLETKIDESTSRMEAMFREILAGKASHTNSTVTQSTSLQDTVHLVALQVTPAPTAIIETARPPSPTLAASGVSHPHGQEQKWPLRGMSGEGPRWGKLKYVSGERRAESRVWRAESRNFWYKF